eukprot:TRINITY_DN3253_c0_g1_i2.p1 TRINITY_DN3253_c0_g1~~TRINITY_DN3253_c0_g1_i2.p1  ORF type:complete len:440 (-),score=116.43 TRINITY_DN3253_c0_g1_i2:340-1659(-)
MAVLLSGDKDFMPAMLRTREKGKRVGLCSMRNSCNRALLDPAAHTMDFGVIWLDDYFDELFEKQRGRMENSPMPADMLCEMVAGILEKHGSAMSSRLLGRELQAIKVGNVNILNLVKEHFGHLRAFLESYNDSFICSLPNASGLTASQKAEYMVMLREEEEHEIREAKLGGAAEDSNSATAAVAADVDDYDSTDEEGSLASEEQHEQRQQVLQFPPLPDNLESFKVQELKDLLKERGLPVVGRKSELIERLQEFVASLPLPLNQQDDVSSDDDDEDQLAESSTRAGDADEAWNDEKEVHRYTPYTYEEALAARGNSRKPAGKSRRLEEALKRAKESMQSARVESKIDFAAADALLRDAITSFLSNQPAHEATGRNVGRHLTAMRWPEDMGRSIDTPTALAYLKHRHGSLSQFLLEHNKDVETYTSTTGSIPELMVKLIE